MELGEKFRDILEDYIMNKDLKYWENGRMYINMDNFNCLIKKLLKEVISCKYKK